MSNQTRILYFVLSVVFCISTFYEPYPFAWLIKILPMLVLIITVLLHVIVKSSLPKVANNLTTNQNGKTMKILLLALIFSSGGDVLLAINSPSMFIFGLGSFLIAHLFYLLCFKPFVFQRTGYIVGLLMLGAGLFSLMANNLNELFIPVLVYMLVLLGMCIGALMSTKSNKWLIIGGISFLISDSLIGLNKFYTNIPFSGLLIMSTYYFAQFCLVTGLINATNTLPPLADGNKVKN